MQHAYAYVYLRVCVYVYVQIVYIYIYCTASISSKQTCFPVCSNIVQIYCRQKNGLAPLAPQNISALSIGRAIFPGCVFWVWNILGFLLLFFSNFLASHFLLLGFDFLLLCFSTSLLLLFSFLCFLLLFFSASRLFALFCFSMFSASVRSMLLFFDFLLLCFAPFCPVCLFICVSCFSCLLHVSLCFSNRSQVERDRDRTQLERLALKVFSTMAHGEVKGLGKGS